MNSINTKIGNSVKLILGGTAEMEPIIFSCFPSAMVFIHCRYQAFHVHLAKTNPPVSLGSPPSHTVELHPVLARRRPHLYKCSPHPPNTRATTENDYFWAFGISVFSERDVGFCLLSLASRGSYFVLLAFVRFLLCVYCLSGSTKMIEQSKKNSILEVYFQHHVNIIFNHPQRRVFGPKKCHPADLPFVKGFKQLIKTTPSCQPFRLTFLVNICSSHVC